MRAFPTEMFVPMIAARMKEWNDLAVDGVKAGDIGSFVAVAGRAAERKVFGGRGSTVLPGDNVINGKPLSIKFLSHEAVFASVMGPLSHLLFKRAIHVDLCHAVGILKRDSGFGLEEGKEVTQIQVTIKFLYFVV